MNNADIRAGLSWQTQQWRLVIVCIRSLWGLKRTNVILVRPLSSSVYNVTYLTGLRADQFASTLAHPSRMSLYEHIKGAALFVMTLFGSFGNIATILSFMQIAYQERKILPVEIILSSLSGVNLLILLSRGIPYPLFIFGVIVSFNDPACKAVSYIHIWFRSLGVNLTCLLSCFQCVTITSSTAKWVTLKGILQKHLLTLISFLCLVSMASSVDIILFGSSGTNVTGLQNTIFNGYCLNTLPSKIVFDTINYLIFARDVAFLLLMTLSSCVILIILYKHQKKVSGIRSSEKNLKTTAEGQATKTVAIIVVMYVFFFGMGTTIWFYEAVADTKVHFLAVIPDFLSVCYSSFFPMVIIMFNKRIQNVLKDFFSKSEKEHSVTLETNFKN